MQKVKPGADLIHKIPSGTFQWQKDYAAKDVLLNNSIP